MVSIKPEHIIAGLLKKPGAMNDWKHRNILFERPAWLRFYNHLIKSGGSDKQYLSCLNLINKHGREVVTIAMQLAVESSMALTSSTLEKLITNSMENVNDIKPITPKLHVYDELLGENNNGSQSKSKA